MIRILNVIGKSCVASGKCFLEETTFHGFGHLIKPRRHWLEIFLWGVIVFAASVGACWIILQSYQRYEANPTVISLVKEFRVWNVTFPASTFCFIDKLDKTKAKEVIKRKWNVEEGAEKFDYYMKFLRVLANSSYYNLEDFREFSEDEQLQKENLTSLMYEVNFELSFVLRPTLFNKVEIRYFTTMMEFGICFTVNALLARELVPTWDAIKDLEEFEPQFCLYLNVACYGVTENIPRPIVYFVHSPYEIPHVSNRGYELDLKQQMYTHFYHFDIVSSKEIRNLRPNQRNCYFYDEPQETFWKYYSANLCQMRCRRVLAMKLCNCVPHFYMAREGEPQCTVSQLLCIQQHRKEIITLLEFSDQNKNGKRTCNCFQSCEELTYYLDSSNYDPSKFASMSMTIYNWNVEKFRKTRFRRDIIFGIEDLLVSFGGTIALFLGCSFMSGVELFYYFTLRFLRHLCAAIKSKNNNQTKHMQAKLFTDPRAPPTLEFYSWRRAIS